MQKKPGWPKTIHKAMTTPGKRYRVLRGGRGSHKTSAAAYFACMYGMEKARKGHSGVILCAREFLRSLEDSSLTEIKKAIASDPDLTAFYDVGEKYVRSKCGNIKFIFAGLRHNLESLKSKAQILLCWVDEAEPVSEMAWMKLLPTVIRHPQSELWVTYNPENPESATDVRWFQKRPKKCMCLTVNHNNSPFFKGSPLEEQMEADKQILDQATFDWVWNGAYLEKSDAQIFANKFKVDEFEPAASWDGPYLGGDFGFAQDPTAAVKCWIYDNRLFIEYEAGQTGLELDDTARFIRRAVPGFERYVSRWDNARPESISFIRRHGLPQAIAVDKWPGSVEDGIAFMRSFREIVLHPRCKETIREFKLYSYKRDRLSGDVQPDIVDAHNHYIDAIRYALAPMIQNNTLSFDRFS